MNEAELTAEERGFLLGIVNEYDSDYHDGLGGWPNYYIDTDGVLTISFESDEEALTDRTIVRARWQLKYLDSEKIKP